MELEGFSLPVEGLRFGLRLGFMMYVRPSHGRRWLPSQTNQAELGVGFRVGSFRMRTLIRTLPNRRPHLAKTLSSRRSCVTKHTMSQKDHVHIHGHTTHVGIHE